LASTENIKEAAEQGSPMKFAPFKSAQKSTKEQNIQKRERRKTI